MKTVKEWFELIKDEKIRTEALENMKIITEDIKCENVNDALAEGFTWMDTRQGHDYWSAIEISKIELLEEQPIPSPIIEEAFSNIKTKKQMKTKELIERIEALERKLEWLPDEHKKGYTQPEPEPEHKLIMSVDDLSCSIAYEDWRLVNGIITDTFIALKIIEQNWNDGKVFEWKTSEYYKYSYVYIYENKWIFGRHMKDKPHFFNFHNEQHSELFLTTFAKELEIIKPLLS